MLRKSTREPEVPVSENTEQRRCLLVMLLPQLVLAEIRPWPLAGFVCEGKRYRDAGFGEWTEFYDWLRDSDSNVLGVRFWLSSETEFLSDYAEQPPYVQIDPSRYLEIYFSENREISQQRSSDQDFLYDGIFRSDDGQYAIGFGMGGLSETDIVSLHNAGARWAKAGRTD